MMFAAVVMTHEGWEGGVLVHVNTNTFRPAARAGMTLQHRHAWHLVALRPMVTDPCRGANQSGKQIRANEKLGPLAGPPVGSFQKACWGALRGCCGWLWEAHRELLSHSWQV